MHQRMLVLTSESPEQVSATTFTLTPDGLERAAKELERSLGQGLAVDFAIASVPSGPQVFPARRRRGDDTVPMDTVESEWFNRQQAAAAPETAAVG